MKPNTLILRKLYTSDRRSFAIGHHFVHTAWDFRNTMTMSNMMDELIIYNAQNTKQIYTKQINMTTITSTNNYAIARVVQPSPYNTGIVPSATLVVEDTLAVLPTATVVSVSSSDNQEDDVSAMSSLLFSDDETSSMDQSSSQDHTLTIDEQLHQLPKHTTPNTSRELQEMISRQQPSFAVAPRPSYDEMKRRRKGRQTLAAIAGGSFGLAALGPLGLAIGVVGGATITKGVSKARERKVLKRYEQRTTHLNMVPARFGELV